MTFKSLVNSAKASIKKEKPENIESAINVAIAGIKKKKGGKKVNVPRTIKLPPITGGVLPLIPIFAGLGALGSIVGTSAGILKTINEARNAQTHLEESKRHNATMEAIAIGESSKRGRGFYLHAPRKEGKGFYLSSKTSKNR